MRLTFHQKLLAVASIYLLWLPRRLFSPVPPLWKDAALFEYTGWYMTQGALPYVHVLDVKPPLIYLLSAGLSTLTGGDPFLQHAASRAVMAGFLVGIVLLSALLVHEATGSERGALVAAVLPLAFHKAMAMAYIGLRPKYPTLFFGLLAVYLYLRNRPLASGAAAAASAGFWQFGLVFALTTMSLSLTDARDNPRDTLRFVTGMGIVTGVTFTPFILQGAFWSMLIQAVGVPLLTSEPLALAAKATRAWTVLGPAALVLVAGVLGGLVSLYRGRARWSAPLVFGFLFHLAVDFDGKADLIPVFFITALGAGLLVGFVDLWQSLDEPLLGLDPAAIESGQLVLLAGVVVLLVLNFPNEDMFRLAVYPDFYKPDRGMTVRKLYWTQEYASDCFVRSPRDAPTWATLRETLGENLCGGMTYADFKTVFSHL